MTLTHADMSCSRSWNGPFYEKLRQRLTQCYERNAGTEPVCVDVIVKDWNNASSWGAFTEQGAATGLEEGPAHVVRDEHTNEDRRWRKRRRPTFEKFEWKSEVVWQMIEAVQRSIRELETMQSASDARAKIGCRYAVVLGDARYGVKAPISTKLVAVYLDNSCLYQIVCASIVAMGYAFVPLHRQWSRNVISEVMEACGAMTVFWSQPYSTGCCKPASRGAPGGL